MHSTAPVPETQTLLETENRSMLVKHTLEFLQGIVVIAVGVITAYYLLGAGLLFAQITNTANPIWVKTLQTLGGIGNGIATMAQFNKLIKELIIFSRNDPTSDQPSFLRTIGTLAKIGVFLLAASTLFGAFLLAKIQMGEAKEYIEYSQWFENTIAFVNAASSELPQVVFGLMEIYFIKKLFLHLSKEITNLTQKPIFNSERRGSESSGTGSVTFDNYNYQEHGFVPSVYPRLSITLTVSLVSILLLLILLACYIDEYFRMLPEGVGIVTGNILAGLSVPGVVSIFLLGLASISIMLENSSTFEFNLPNMFNLAITVILSVSASLWEFLMGTETARGYVLLGWILGACAMIGRALINAPFIYEFLKDLLEMVRTILTTMVNGYNAIVTSITDALEIVGSIPTTMMNGFSALVTSITDAELPRHWPIPPEGYLQYSHTPP